jgi:hypothetical protein
MGCRSQAGFRYSGSFALNTVVQIHRAIPAVNQKVHEGRGDKHSDARAIIARP